jgi:hypothetical protein
VKQHRFAVSIEPHPTHPLAAPHRRNTHITQYASYSVHECVPPLRTHRQVLVPVLPVVDTTYRQGGSAGSRHNSGPFG